MNKKDRIHDWRKLKWPFTATFLYYSLLSLYTGTAEQSEQGFLVMFLTVLIVDAVAYFSYCYFLCKKRRTCRSSGSSSFWPMCSSPYSSSPSSGR